MTLDDWSLDPSSKRNYRITVTNLVFNSCHASPDEHDGSRHVQREAARYRLTLQRCPAYHLGGVSKNWLGE